MVFSTNDCKKLIRSLATSLSKSEGNFRFSVVGTLVKFLISNSLAASEPTGKPFSVNKLRTVVFPKPGPPVITYTMIKG